MHNKGNKKLTKLNIEIKKAKEFLKNNPEIGLFATVDVAGMIATGVANAAFGLGVEEAALLSGAASSSLAFTEAMDFAMASNRKNKLKIARNAIATGIAAGALGAGVAAGTHELTSLIMDKAKPEHQIEQVVEVEQMPVIDEIQVEK